MNNWRNCGALLSFYFTAPPGFWRDWSGSVAFDFLVLVADDQTFVGFVGEKALARMLHDTVYFDTRNEGRVIEMALDSKLYVPNQCGSDFSSSVNSLSSQN